MGTEQDLPPCRVVIIDDERDSADALAALLRQLGQDVYSAYDGPSGITLIHGCRPHVVLLDLVMPDMTGFEILRAVRADPGLKRVRVVALTGLGGPRDVNATLGLGFDGHIVKPASVEILAEMLRRSCPGTDGATEWPAAESPLVSL